MKAFWIVGAVIALGGCALPPAASIAASTLVDGALLVGTGKTSMDHGLSYASGRDCAMWRVLDGVAVCKDNVAAVQSAVARDVPALVPEHPAEIVGHEAPFTPLDGES